VKRSLGQIFRDLTGRAGRAVIAPVDAQVDVVERAIHAVRDACCDVSTMSDIADVVAELEREGDSRRTDVTRFLSSALITPIDREDLFRLSRSIDDVLDNVRDFGRELALYEPPDPRGFVPMLDSIEHGVDELRAAVRRLDARPTEVVDAARTAAHAAAQIRRRYEEAISALLDGDVDQGSLGQRELLRRLDVVGLRLGEAANTLADGALKRVE
jgi:uncharacterized protein Yka (UPF0111/DUF47 family)